MKQLETIKNNDSSRNQCFVTRDALRVTCHVSRVTCHVLLVLFFLVLSSSLFSQGTKEEPKPKPTTRILFVFDASQSMYGRWQSDTKFDIAVKLFSNLLDSLRSQTNLELALRMYGNQKQFPPQDCNDTHLEVPFAKDNISKIKHVLKTTIPKGTTPIEIMAQPKAMMGASR